MKRSPEAMQTRSKARGLVEQAQPTTPAPQDQPEGPFAGLFPELIAVIASFLPHVSLAGQHRVHMVSRQWHSALHRAQVKTIFSNQELIDAVETPEDCLRLLSDAMMLKRFNINELLQIVCKHPQIVDAIIDKLAVDELVMLGKRSIDITRRILNTPQLVQKMKPTKNFLHRLIGYHAEIANAYIDQQRDENTDEYPEIYFIEELGYHLSLAQRMMDNPNLFKRLDGHSLNLLCQRHPSILKQVLSRCTQETCADSLACQTRHEKAFVLNASDNKELSTFIVNEHADLLSDADLSFLAWKQPSVAQTVFDTPSLLAKLSRNDVLRLANTHAFIARRLLQTPTILSERFPSAEFTEPKYLPLQAYQSPKINELVMNGSLDGEDFHWWLLRFCMENPAFRNQYGKLLMDLDFDKKCGPNHLAFFIQTLKNPNLKKFLNGNVLSKLCASSYEAAMLVLKDNTLKTKLGRYDLKDLALKHEDFALTILDDLELLIKLRQLPEYSGVLPLLEGVCGWLPVAGRRLLQDPAFSTMIKGRREFPYLIEIRELIVATKDALLKDEKKEEKEITHPAKKRRLGT